MQDMARYGRNGDTRMAHLTPGETVVPKEVLRQNPQVARGLGKAFQDAGSDPRRYVVGSGQNSINPVTGKPEFFFDKIIPFLGKLASNPSVQGAIGNVALRKLQGKDVSLRDALLGGAIGGGLGAMSGRGTGVPFLDNMLDVDPGLANKLTGGGSSTVGSLSNAESFGQNLAKKQLQDAAGSKRAEGLMGIGEFFGTNPDSVIGKMLNTKFGESIAMGLGSQLLDSLFSEDVDPDPYGNRARFERGAGEGPISLKPRPLPDRRVPQYANGGAVEPQYYNEGGPAYSLAKRNYDRNDYTYDFSDFDSDPLTLSNVTDMLQHQVGIRSFEGDDLNRYDFNRDGKVDQLDTDGAMKNIVGMEDGSKNYFLASRPYYGTEPAPDAPVDNMPIPDQGMTIGGPAQFNDGGAAYYPRRNGGIMPSEGSGTKDDVPAMLTAGEFVMTRDAVKGAGNGNLNSGINKMYGMMDRLERKA
jgi:hypothetical protein